MPSRSRWQRRRDITDRNDEREVHVDDSRQFPDEELRVLERDVMLPGSKTKWRFQIAASRESLDEQVRAVRATLIPSLFLLGLGLIVLAALQTVHGLWPLRHLPRPIPPMRRGPHHPVPPTLPPRGN